MVVGGKKKKKEETLLDSGLSEDLDLGTTIKSIKSASRRMQTTYTKVKKLEKEIGENIAVIELDELYKEVMTMVGENFNKAIKAVEILRERYVKLKVITEKYEREDKDAIRPAAADSRNNAGKP